MNIDIANRLFELRKKMNLSQEELAEKIGVSRQAISKWERAESSPDTDNLISLARLYGVSLDELLFTSEPIEKKEEPKAGYISIVPKDGVRVVNEGGGELHIKVDSGTEINEKNAQKKDSYYKKHVKKTVEETAEAVRTKLIAAVPAPLIITGIYLILGLFLHLWHPGWIVFLFIPMYYQFLAMTKVEGTRKKLNCVPIVFICLVSFLFVGFVFKVWHPTWIVFLVIPLYYSLVNSMFKN